MDQRLSLPRLDTFAQRYRFALFLGLIALAGLYLILPLGASYLLTQGLSRYGYDRVIVQLGYPGFRGMEVPIVSLQQSLGGETLLLSLTNAEIRYSLPQLLRGHVDRVALPDVAIQVLTVRPRGADGVDKTVQTEEDESPWSFLTAGDLLRRLPILPFDELRLERVTIFREEATGPLRKVTVSGILRYRDGELDGYLSFQGQDTVSYGLTVAGRSAGAWSATLVSQRLQTVPIVSWQSQAHPNGAQIQVNGQLDVNVRELAPFIALLVPIGPDVGKVTGRIAVHWTGTAAADTALSSLWRDLRTRLDGYIQAQITLPALKGIAKDVEVAWQGTFTGNAMEVGWTLAPGVPLMAAVNDQTALLPDALRKIFPHGDHPVRVENVQPLRGTLYWSESPVRTIVKGPVRVTYGRISEPLLVELEATRAEWRGHELLSAEGTYHVAGAFPKAVADMVSAHDASVEFRGTLALTHAHVQGVVLPSSSVTARHIERGMAVIPSVMLQVTDPLPLRCDLAHRRCGVGPTTVAVRIPTMRVMGREIRVAQGILALQLAESVGNAWHAQGKLSIRGVSLNSVPWEIQPTDWKIRFLANQAGIKADLRVDAPFQENLVSAEIDQPLTGGKGMLHGTIGPIEFDGDAHRLSKLLTRSPRFIELTGGRLASTFDVSWSDGVGDRPRGVDVTSGIATVVADKLSGRYEDYTVKDASATVVLRAQGSQSVATVEPAFITIASVRTGVEATNVSAMVQGTWMVSDPLPVIKVTNFKCEAFGGTITSAGVLVDPAQPPYHMTLSLQNLDLAKILSVERNQGLQGTGTMSGTLPLSITSTGVRIKDGMMIAMPPGGIIRYGSAMDSPEAIAEANTHPHLVTQDLSNFHYTALRVGVNYAESGMLFLTARLEGRNPDHKKAPSINFNLTVQKHIPTLLKSLRLAEELEGTMEGTSKQP